LVELLVLLLLLLFALGDFLAFGFGEILLLDLALGDFLAFGFLDDFDDAFALGVAVGAAVGLTDGVGLELVAGVALGFVSVIGGLTFSLTFRPASR